MKWPKAASAKEGHMIDLGAFLIESSHRTSDEDVVVWMMLGFDDGAEEPRHR